MAKHLSNDDEQNEQEGPYEKFNFRLNLANPKERIIWEFLQSHASSREASRVAKQILYEGFTGRSWLNDRPLQPTMPTVAGASQIEYSEPEPKPLYIEGDLEDLEAGLGDWWSQGSNG